MNDTPKHPASSVHREIVLEQHLVSQLVQGQGYLERRPDDYDRPLAVDKALVVRFVRETQPDEWLKLESQYASSAEGEFFKQLEKALKQRGTLDVLRQGIKLIPGIRFALFAFSSQPQTSTLIWTGSTRPISSRRSDRAATASRTRMRSTWRYSLTASP
jgi:type I restriction enzyme R subunit